MVDPCRLVRAAVETLATQFFEPLAVDELLRDAWRARPLRFCVPAGRTCRPPGLSR
jgi:hypothetical protein